ncbi:30S ribosomal protein S18 [Mariprofundus erugo]|uniref:Small ribosomal subunit protein bS18 n=1 Tax=Mariprofundus erugo TaxID=2528639 RepID=A0A5R9H3Q1_9PROT|nr:30S ribosomal protein S18 [Mariprofundus erugo]TLS75322.1 30S ribosomal protein S18 [Mariprofundus erugo]
MSEEVKATTRPQGARPQGPRPQGDRPQGDRPRRPQGDRPQGDRPQGGAGAGGRFQRRRKFCKFCADKSLKIDHKDPDMLRSFITERYKILPSRVTGTCSAHQRSITTAVKRARVIALLAFTPLHHD